MPIRPHAELVRRSRPMQEGVWDKMMCELSTHNYGAVVKYFHNAYGVEKSAVSENFIEASREKVKRLGSLGSFDVGIQCINASCGGGGGQAVREPVTFLLAGSGLIGMYFVRRRQAKPR